MDDPAAQPLTHEVPEEEDELDLDLNLDMDFEEDDGPDPAPVPPPDLNHVHGCQRIAFHANIMNTPHCMFLLEAIHKMQKGVEEHSRFFTRMVQQEIIPAIFQLVNSSLVSGIHAALVSENHLQMPLEEFQQFVARHVDTQFVNSTHE